MLDLNTSKGTHIAERLRTEPIIWLSTTRPDGRPHLVPVWFLWEDQTMLIFSKPDNQKIRNLRHNPSVMLALEAADQGEDVVLLEGRATLLDEPTSTLMSAAYVEKYAKLIARMQWKPEEMAAEYSQAIRVDLTRLISW
ncbi:MAG TPA: TIGR03667 family PPOX class F420-dependent oxidoreductase [Herpetosiphonaceae bacterium]